MKQNSDTSYQESISSRVSLRLITADDLPFIYATWLKGLRYGNATYKQIDKTVYYTKYQVVIKALLGSSNVIVACLTSDPETIVGYSVSNGDTLHWVYVKESWRQLGVATLVVPNSVHKVSHLTDIGAKAMKKRYIFDPFL
jgi:hypothetical protein